MLKVYEGDPYHTNVPMSLYTGSGRKFLEGLYLYKTKQLHVNAVRSNTGGTQVRAGGDDPIDGGTLEGVTVTAPGKSFDNVTFPTTIPGGIPSIIPIAPGNGGGQGGESVGVGGSNNGSAGNSGAKLSPCESIQLSNTVTSNQSVRDAINQIKDTKYENGAKLFIKDPTSIDGLYTDPISTQGNKSSWTLTGSTWNPTGGYVIGVVHNHPQGSSPEPKDIMNASQISAIFNDPNIPQAQKDFYASHFTSTVVTSDYIYTMSIRDAQKFINYQSNFDQTAAVNRYIEIAKMYVNDRKSSGEEASEYAILKMYGDAIYVSKQSINGKNENKDIQLDSNNKPRYINPCP